MRRTTVRSLLALCLLWIASGCDGGDGDACVIDSDCASFADVCIAGTCRPAGADPEAGTPDAGRRRDAGAGDAGPAPMDSGPGDAGAGDAGPPIEAGPMMCADASGTWMVANNPVGCGAAVAGTEIVITNAPPGSCSYDAAVGGGSDVSEGVVGTFTLDMSDALMGNLDTGGQGTMICTGALVAGVAINIVCGSCSMNLARM